MSKLWNLIERFRRPKAVRFEDTVHVYTAPSGSQYVHPIDVLITQEEKRRIFKETRDAVLANAPS